MSSPQSLASAPDCPPVDFVSGDVAALASHMDHCARAHGPLFAVKRHLQRARSAAAGRIVTVACVGGGARHRTRRVA